LLWLDSTKSYKFVLKNAGGVTQWTQDNISGAASVASLTGIFTKVADLAASSGASLVGYLPAGTGAVATTVQTKLRESVSVKDFGAVCDGVTNDSAACQLMLAATGGVLVLSDGEMLVENFQITGYDKVTIIGKGRPEIAADRSQLAGGSILLGLCYVRANAVHFESFGVDSGSRRTLTNRGGLWADAKVGELGSIAYADNITCLNKSSAGVWHGLTLQGYGINEVDNILVGRQQFGVVVKGRNCNIGSVTAVDCRTAAVYPKSDLPASAGDVQDGTVKYVNVRSVINTADVADTTSVGVYVQASTASISTVNIDSVIQVYGRAGVLLAGGGTISDPTCSGINVGKVFVDRSQVAVDFDGFVYDININEVIATNPVTGMAVRMTANTTVWNVGNVEVVVTDAAVTGSVALQLYGVGCWGNVTVRNSFRAMTVSVPVGQLGQIACGNTSAGVTNSNNATLTGINGAVGDATYQPKVRILPGSVVKLSGRFDLTASANKFFCNLPITTGKDIAFACGGIDSGGNYAAVAVRLNSFQLSIEPTLPAGFRTIDLEGITIPMM
jgi:hypothetical protein